MVVQPMQNTVKQSLLARLVFVNLFLTGDAVKMTWPGIRQRLPVERIIKLCLK
jgi:hypothetical protein